MHWSGLAPAVDEHLRLWNRARRYDALVRRVYDHRSVADFEAMVDVEYLSRWVTFAMSYGLPDENGVPQLTAGLIEGQTITGREQYTADAATGILQGAALALRETKMLAAATTHYVSAAVVDEVTAAAEDIEPEPLHHTDLFTPNGFAVLERPFLVPDLHEDTGRPDPDVRLAIRAFGWSHSAEILHTDTGEAGFVPGITLWLYTTGRDYRASYVADHARIGRPVTDETLWADGDELLPSEVMPWAFSSTWGTRADDIVHYVPGTVPSPQAYQRRWFLAFMRFCWQRIIVAHRPEIGRNDTRRWERDARRKPMLDYTVLRLRREADPAHTATGTGSPLDHQVLVRGHWRRVYVPSIGGSARLEDGSMNPENHRLVWVESYWRGPEDSPIGAMSHATVVTR